MNPFLSSAIFPKGVTIFRFYLEDYWLFCAVDRIAKIFPQADWVGIFDTFSLWEEAEFATDADVPFPFGKKAGGGLEAAQPIKNYSEGVVLETGIRREYKPSKLIVSPTHIVSRLSYDHYAKKYPELKILSIDAHDDHGEGQFPDNLWIPDDIVIKTLLIGGQAELALQNQKKSHYLAIFDDIEATLDSQLLRETLRNQNLLLSIDLDFFQKFEWGFPTFLARELFIGHSMNISQRIMSFLALNPSKKDKRLVIGEILDLFSSESEMERFRQHRLESIKREGANAKEQICCLLDLLEDINSNVVSIDLCEFCAPLDYEGAGAKALIDLCDSLLMRF